jgi:hypothetical protein
MVIHRVNIRARDAYTFHLNDVFRVALITLLQLSFDALPSFFAELGEGVSDYCGVFVFILFFRFKFVIGLVLPLWSE